MLFVVRADAALSGVVGKAAHFSTTIERHDGIFAQGAKAHGRYIQEAGGIGLTAGCIPNRHPWVLYEVVGIFGGDGVVEPFVPFPVKIELCAKGRSIAYFFRPLIDHRAVNPVDGAPVGVGFDEILVKLGAKFLQHIPPPAKNRKIAHHRVAGLHHIIKAEPKDRSQQNQPPDKWRPKEIGAQKEHAKG